MTLLQQEGWTRWPTEVPSNPYHSVILWFCDSVILWFCSSLLLQWLLSPHWRHLTTPRADTPSILLLLLSEESQKVPDPEEAHMEVPMSWWRDMSIQTPISCQSRRRGIRGNILWLFRALETSRGQTHLFPSCYMFALEIGCIYFPNLNPVWYC